MDDLSPEHAEALARGLFEAVPAGVVHVRCDGSITAANAEALRLLGLDHAELTRRSTRDFGADTVREDGTALPIAECPVSLALQTGRPQAAVTLGMRLPDGKTSWVVTRALPVKDPNTGTLLGAIVTFIDVTERKLAEQELRASRDLLRKAQELARVGTWEWDLTTDSVRWTEQMYDIHGMTHDQFGGTLQDAVAVIHPHDRAQLGQRMAVLLHDHAPLSDSYYRIVRPDGTERSVWASAELVFDGEGRAVKAIGAVQDLTERQQLETQVRQMQRLESIGQLAGGIAHDFNNLLQPIIINADLILRGGEPQGPIAEIKLAARRGAELTQRLLAFGRRQPLRPMALDLNRVIEPFVALLRRTLGERISLEVDLAPRLGAVLGDRGQLEQVIMNLAVNARDAMPNGGCLSIQTRETSADVVPVLHQLPPQWASPRCIEIAISDSGLGMDSKIQARAFEPFFTTKEVGAGTGLGLAVAYGIVQEHDGRIVLESRPGQGSTFRVYLPVYVSAPRRIEMMLEPGDYPAGAETLLVVEDDPAVRRSTVQVLQAANFRTLAAADAESALVLFLQHADEIALVVTDVIMPGRSGPELVREMRWHRPDTRVVFMTGHSADFTGDGVSDPILNKPYDISELLVTIRTVLDGPSPAVVGSGGVGAVERKRA